MASSVARLRRIRRPTVPSPSLLPHSSRSLSSQPLPKRYPVAIAFDIDGVLLRGGQPIHGAQKALRKLFKGNIDPSPTSHAQIPFIFLTNGGGSREFMKASELSGLLDVPILPEQLYLGHTSFKSLHQRFADSYVLAVGKGEPKAVMTEYGYRNVVSVEEYVLHFKDIDPLAKFKHWSTLSVENMVHIEEKASNPKPVEAVFIASDPVDWGRDIQVLCDVLRSGGCPGKTCGSQPPIYFAADDFEYQAAFAVERLGMGAFRVALEAVYNRISKHPLNYFSYGKPKVPVFRYAEIALLRVAEGLELKANSNNFQQTEFESIYMIGDNPATDILGARQAGKPWFSILTRTGCFKGKGNDELHPADMVVEDVQEAIQFILGKHGLEV